MLRYLVRFLVALSWLVLGLGIGFGVVHWGKAVMAEVELADDLRANGTYSKTSRPKVESALKACKV